MSTSSRSVWVLSVLSGELAFQSVYDLLSRSASDDEVEDGAMKVFEARRSTGEEDR